MTGSGISRRSLLKSCSLVALGGSVAGCSDSPDVEPSSTPEPTDGSGIDLEALDTAVPETAADTPTATPLPDYEIDHLHSITGRTAPPDIDGVHQRRFEWEAVGGEWWLEQNIPKALAEYYEARYGRSRRYGTYVTDPYDDEFIRSIATEFERMGEDNDLSQRETVELAKSFVQSLRYTEDDVSSGFDQYSFYPVETLTERGGDCEDSSILLAAILLEMGYDCVLLGLFDAEPSHMALGVKGDDSVSGTYYEYAGNRYYYVETTGKGYEIGEVPPLGGSTRAEIIEIEPEPVIVYQYQSSVQTGRTVEVRSRVRNVGSETATDATFVAEFENRSGQVVAQSSTSFSPLAPDRTESVSVELEPPEGEALRLRTAILRDDAIHDLHVSDWRYPA